MGLRVGTLGRRSKKAGALVLAAAIGTLAPGVSPLTAGTPVASAQEAAEERAAWMPPEPSGPVPTVNSGFHQPVEKKQECVSSTVGDKNHIGTNKPEILKPIPWGQSYLQVDKVHDYVRTHSKDGTVGGGIKVAVIDTGVTKHKFLAGRLESGGDFVAKPEHNLPPGLQDCDGHGTQVAGIIAAKPTDPDVGFIGMAPDATIVSFRQTSQAYQVKDKETLAREDEERKQRDKAAAAAKAAEKAVRDAQEQAKSAEDRAKAAEKAAKENGDGGGESVSGSTEPGQAPPGEDGGRSIGAGQSAGDLDSLAQAVVKAANTRGVKIINMSIDSCRSAIGSYVPNDKERRLQRAIRYAVEKDVVVVAAAGNKGGQCIQNGELNPENPSSVPNPMKPDTIVTPPWFSEDLLAVAAIDKRGSVAEFSMHGPWISVAAPGTEATSLDPATGSDMLVNQMIENNQPQPLQGTSFASPYVAGLVALIRQLNPDMSARDVMKRIKETAQHPGAPGGRDQYVGYGVIDPMSALTATLPQVKAQPINLGSDMPPPGSDDNTPMVVALAGAGGATAALGIVLVSVHAVRRTRERREALLARR